MKHTAFRILRALCGMVVMLALAAGITAVPAQAASNGIYIADAAPHYRHPTTGTIEDAGGDGSSVLGQSMTESATYKKALVEVDASGNTYITVRLQLMDNIENPQFQVDGSRNGSFTPVSASLMQEDYINNTADYRMKVPNENAIIRCNMYVTAMGRDVIFYITVSDLRSGSDDFITSIKVEQPKPTTAPTPTVTEKPVQTPKPTAVVQPTEAQPTSAGVTQPAAQTTVSGEQPTDAAPTGQGEELTDTPSVTQGAETLTETPTPEQGGSGTSVTDSADITVTSPAKNDKAQGLQEFDASGNRVDSSAADTVAQKEDGGGSSVTVWIAAVVLVIAAAGFCVWYFQFFKKKK